MLEAQSILRDEGFNITFSMTAVDGVYCDPEYVKISYEVSSGGN